MCQVALLWYFVYSVEVHVVVLQILSGVSCALHSVVCAEMSYLARLLILIHFRLSFEESLTLQIPLRHSITKFVDADTDSGFNSRSKRALLGDPNYNLHGMVGQGYYIELAVGQPEQKVNHAYSFLYNFLYNSVTSVYNYTVSQKNETLNPCP